MLNQLSQPVSSFMKWYNIITLSNASKAWRQNKHIFLTY